MHRGLAAGDLGNQCPHPFHGRRFTQQVLGIFGIRGQRFAAQLQRRRDQFAQIIQVERFGHKIKGTELQRPHRGFHAAVGSDHRHGDTGRFILNPFHQIQAAAIGQAHVREAQIHGSLPQRGLGTFYVAAGARVDVHAVECDGEQLADIRLVIHHQCHWVHALTLQLARQRSGSLNTTRKILPPPARGS